MTDKDKNTISTNSSGVRVTGMYVCHVVLFHPAAEDTCVVVHCNDRLGAVRSMLEVCVFLHVNGGRSSTFKGSPTASRRGWIEHCLPLPLCRGGRRTEPRRRTNQKCATPFETPEGSPFGTERTNIPLVKCVILISI